MATESSRKPGRPKDPELEARRRTEILTVAARVFAQSGFAATDVQIIADRVGVGKGTIYRYFPSKDALFLAAVEHGLTELSSDMDAALADRTCDPLGQLETAIRTYLRFFRRRPEMAELFIQERAAFLQHHRPLYFTVKEGDEKECQHRELFQRLHEGGYIRDIPQERFFAVVGDLLYGTILTNLLTGRPADPDTQVADILDIVLNGVLATGPPQRSRRIDSSGAKQ
ncbi:MAG: TetR/AcrR family transcriptional regulator [Bacteroidales bacterium]|nr:TetR/AcrR family transcriptional regulator [Bacteroidales bacterium]